MTVVSFVKYEFEKRMIKHIQSVFDSASLNKVLSEHGLFFFTANALLALGLMKLYVSIKSYSLENLYKIMVDKNYLGILSSGVITKDEKLIPLNQVL